MMILLVHGWGFDAGFWDAVVARLPDSEIMRADRGYFGAADWPKIKGPCLAVTHSFGAMALLADPPSELCGLLAINGFDRFAEGEGSPGIARRVLERMIARLESDPAATLDDFRARIGASRAANAPDVAALRTDLVAMRDDDRRGATAALRCPVHALHGADDPLLPATVRAAQFDAAAQLTRETVPGGHLLPVTHPDLCAARIAMLRAEA